MPISVWDIININDTGCPMGLHTQYTLVGRSADPFQQGSLVGYLEQNQVFSFIFLLRKKYLKETYGYSIIESQGRTRAQRYVVLNSNPQHQRNLLRRASCWMKPVGGKRTCFREVQASPKKQWLLKTSCVVSSFRDVQVSWFKGTPS